ncbi:MAG: ABC transporter: Multidrug resistance-associated protein, ATP binding protein, partial [Streblomastix strix]
DLLNHVMKAPNSFFDTTPLGRIVNRFSGDIIPNDQIFITIFNGSISLWLGIIGYVVIIAVYNPLFLAFGLPSLVVFYYVLYKYRITVRNMSRLSAISRSSVLSHFNETVTGVGQTSLYSSFLSSVFMAGVVIIGWNQMDASRIYIAINSAVWFAELCLQLIQQIVENESRMTSFERIRFYSKKLPQENSRSEIGSIDPPQNWPQGNLVYENVSFRYRNGLPYVLKDVSFNFKAGEKIGVCGRNGAGNSSLLFALFRLIELDPKLQPKMIDANTGFPNETNRNEEPNKGRILIDGIDISKVDLQRLRSSVAIIPQDPTLFTGTLRYNLDIGNKCNDDRIWEVLRMVEMQEVISNLPLGLDTQVAEGGSNFSAGQRQLICFGRAILNNCRIVVMDEATASVDLETDAKIQKTIREQFADKTVIIISNRLNAIMNSDRIMVMKNGRVAELDTPEQLKNNTGSEFNKLIKS